MQASPKLTIPTNEFKLLLKSLSKINDRAILEISEEQTYSIVNSDDRSMFLWAKLKTDSTQVGTLNIPSLNKLSNLLDMVGGSDITFNWKPNKLEYRGGSMKFDYHLFDDGIIPKPKISRKKIESLKFSEEFKMTKDFLKGLLKSSVNFKDTNKLYITVEDGKMVWTLGDKTKPNTDNMTVIGEDVDFEMEDFILNLDNIRLIDLISDINVKVNDDGIGIISVGNDILDLNYIATSLTN